MRWLPATIVIITTLIFFTACQKEIGFDLNNPTQPIEPPVTNGMRAQINGEKWTADNGAGAARIQGLINITGLSSDKKFLTITLTDSGVHRYILSDATFNVAAMIDSTDGNYFAYTSNQGAYPSQAGGEVNITAIDETAKTISGTFSFALFREMDGAQKTVTEGSFTNLKYITSLPPASATDTFQVKIDGIPWSPASITATQLPVLDQIVVNATNETAEKSIGLNFPSNIAPGSYDLDFWGGTYVGAYNPDADPIHSKVAVSGKLIILEHNTVSRRIRGNFNFRGEELSAPQNFAAITEGYFSVTY